MAEAVRAREDLNCADFMAKAVQASENSPDPDTKVGACIVNKDKNIVGIGYNQMPNGCEKFPWDKPPENPMEDKHLYVSHAELNAIMNKTSADVKGCTMYVTLFPCNECAKLIIQAGIKEVVYQSDENDDKDYTKASKRLLNAAKIPYRECEP